VRGVTAGLRSHCSDCRASSPRRVCVGVRVSAWSVLECRCWVSVWSGVKCVVECGVESSGVSVCVEWSVGVLPLQRLPRLQPPPRLCGCAGVGVERSGVYMSVRSGVECTCRCGVEWSVEWSGVCSGVEWSVGVRVSLPRLQPPPRLCGCAGVGVEWSGVYMSVWSGVECGVEVWSGVECGVEVWSGVECVVEVWSGVECVVEWSGVSAGVGCRCGV
jgi:hypothetical protein